MSYIVTTDNELSQVAAPNLPLATPQYDQKYIDQLNNVLRLYFNQLDKILGQLQTGSGAIDGTGIRFPYGAFSSYTTQSTTANTATLLTLSNTDFSNQVSLVTGSKITTAVAGIYNLQFSVQIENFDNAPQDAYIWLKQNGVDIVGSTGVIGMPARKSALDPFHDIRRTQKTVRRKRRYTTT